MVQASIQNISGVAQGPAVRSVITWMGGEPTVQPWPWHKAGGARPDVRHETARVHIAARRRGGIAARGAGAAADECRWSGFLTRILLKVTGGSCRLFSKGWAKMV